MHDRPVHIGGVNYRRVDVHHGGVVRKDSAIPASPDEANAAIAESIINAAVESNVRAPIACMENVPAAAPAPISRSPEKADSWRHNPCAGHPEITIRPISPISRGPEVSRTRADGLVIYRQRRRSDMHRDAHTNLRRRPNRRTHHYQREQNQS